MIQDILKIIEIETERFIRSKKGRHAALAFRAAVEEGVLGSLTRREFAKTYRGVATESNYRTCMKIDLAPTHDLELVGYKRRIRDIKRLVQEKEMGAV